MSRKITELMYMDLDKLKKHPNNPRTIKNDSFKKLMTSIDENPDFFEARPIMVSDRTGELIIIGGNQRYAAAKELGFKQAPVIVLPALTEEKEKEIMIRDNIANGEWDYDKLANEWDAGQLNEWGLDVPDWDKETANAGLTDPDDVPEPEENPVTVQGDLWVLGDHRLLCGDSFSLEAVELLMDGDKADLIFTDPPYNIASENKGVAANVSKAHENLMASDWDKNFSFASVAPSLFYALADDATVYVCTSHHLSGEIWEWMKTWAKHSNYCVWYKSNPMPSLMKRHWTWCSELVCYGTRGKHVFNFPEDGHALSVWDIHKVNGQTGHPTEKPVAVPEHAILHSSNPNQIVLDLFAGSGSTLIACEKQGRRAYLMDFNPVYIDVIIKRWQDFSGKIAVLESTGQTFEEVKAERHG